MSQHRNTLRSDETIEPADLLNADGTVDTNAVRTRQASGGNNTKVPDATCARWRRDLVGYQSVARSPIDADYNDATVSDHARGACTCEHDEPALRYANAAPRGEWVVADE